MWLPALWAAKPVILVLGDSLSAGHGIDADRGWVTLLQKRLTREGYSWQVVNASVSGDTSSGGLSRLPGALRRYQPSLVIIELGGNDGLRGLDLNVMEHNLARAVTRARQAGARVLLVGVRMPPNYGPAYTRRFTRTYQAVAKRLDVAWVPNLLSGVDDRPGLMQQDGIHPLAKAQPRMLDNVWAHLRPLLRGNARTAGPAATP